jgi:chromosome partitioning protein
MTILSFLNQKGGVGKTTLSIHTATALAHHGAVLLVDADPQGSALDWKAQRTADSKFPVIGLPKPTLRREVSALGRHCHVNRVGPQRPAWIPFQAAALALSHTLNASFRNRLNVSLLHK